MRVWTELTCSPGKFQGVARVAEEAACALHAICGRMRTARPWSGTGAAQKRHLSESGEICSQLPGRGVCASHPTAPREFSSARRPPAAGYALVFLAPSVATKLVADATQLHPTDAGMTVPI